MIIILFHYCQFFIFVILIIAVLIASHNLNVTMYFIVFLIAPKKNVVIPYTWIFGVNQHIEKFMNNGVNSNQEFLAFYTNNNAAFDDNGIPRDDYQANFQASFSEVLPTKPSTDGLYRCYIRKFKCESKLFVFCFVIFFIHSIH